MRPPPPPSLTQTTYTHTHRWLAANASHRYLLDTHGKPHVCRKDHLGNTIYVPDLTVPEVRARWLDTVSATGEALDGVFVDRGDFGAGPGSSKGVDPAKLRAWEAAHSAMLDELRTRMPHKLLLLNDHTHGVFPGPGFQHEYEGFTGTDAQIQQLQNDSHHGRLATAHNEGEFNASLVARATLNSQHLNPNSNAILIQSPTSTSTLAGFNTSFITHLLLDSLSGISTRRRAVRLPRRPVPARGARGSWGLRVVRTRVGRGQARVCEKAWGSPWPSHPREWHPPGEGEGEGEGRYPHYMNPPFPSPPFHPS